MRIGRFALLALLALLVLPIWAQTQHSITVAVPTYVQSATDTAVGINFYRSTTSGGPYTKLNAVPLNINTTAGSPAATFTDTTGVGGTKYFYVATAVDGSNFESAFSNEASATFLANPATPVGVTAVPK